jgi:hypothetical protein
MRGVFLFATVWSLINGAFSPLLAAVWSLTNSVFFIRRRLAFYPPPSGL